MAIAASQEALLLCSYHLCDSAAKSRLVGLAVGKVNYKQSEGNAHKLSSTRQHASAQHQARLGQSPKSNGLISSDLPNLRQVALLAILV